jgi:Tol biopolymer transport system component
MKSRYLLISILLSSLFIACSSGLPVQKIATSADAASTSTPAASTVQNVDAWLMFDLAGESTIRRAVSMAGKPMIELDGAEGQSVIAASPAASQPWYSEYTENVDDGGIAIMKVERNIPTEIIPLLRAKDLTVMEKTVLFEEFKSKDQPFMAWSPDGTRLAYLNIPDGKKTRLMLYDTAAKSSTVTSQATEDVVAPVWSFDGEWILYQTIDGFKPQGMPTVTSMHAVRANGSEDHVLYKPSSLRETVLGWSEREIFVVESSIERGNRDLRLVSIKDGSSLSLNQGLVKSAGWDSSTRTAMYLLTASETNNEQPNGVYAVTAFSSQHMVLPGKWKTLQFFEHAKTWIAGSGGEAGIIRPDGITVTIKGVDSTLDVSADGKFLIVNLTGRGSALYTTDGSKIAVLSDKPVSKAFFSPDSRMIYYQSDYAMFTAAAPDWKPQPFADGNLLIGWVGY